MKPYYTADEAAEILGITLATLYAYVSRGLIRSELVGSDQRKRRYNAEDIDNLKERKESRHQPEKMVENALHFGAPVMESALTLIRDGRCYYRGYEAVELAKTYRIEQVAALLWTGSLENSDLFATTPEPFPKRCEEIRPFLDSLSPFEAFQVILPLAATEDLTSYDTRPEAVARTGVKILRWMAMLTAKTNTLKPTIAETLMPHQEKLMNRVLVLCADHELNASSFTARCVASTGSTPYAVIAAGLAALQGHKHGGHTERVQALFREVREPEQAQQVLANRLKRGEPIPGFGHKLYPQGDPRAQAIFEALEAHYPASSILALSQAIVEAAQKLTGLAPTIDLALVTLCQLFELPQGMPITLFALGRTVGWIGHAIEQYQLDRMIRPRARYIGELPKP